MERSLEVILAPGLFPFRSLKGEAIAVVVDVLRFTSTVCTALFHGAVSVTPVADIPALLSFAGEDHILAGERQGIRIKGARLGNSPFEFMDNAVSGRKIVMTTTNGTEALLTASGNEIVLGSFLNLSLLSGWLKKKHMDVIVLCSGQNGNIILEDIFFAGALAERMRGDYTPVGDGALLSRQLWGLDPKKREELLSQALHINRLRSLGNGKDIEYCFSEDLAPVIPVFSDGVILPLEPGN